MQETSKTPPVPPDSKGHPDNGRERTEAQLEKGMPAHQKRGPQEKGDPDPDPAPDKSVQNR